MRHAPHIMREITPLSNRDCFYIADRHKEAFTYPIHCHPEFELNFTERASGVRRIVGDSEETVGEYDLVLITSPDLEHVWEQGTCTSPDIREITIQFHPDILPESLLAKNQFDSIRRMIERARFGLAFPMATIMQIYTKLDRLSTRSTGFQAVLDFMEILYLLSQSEGARELSTSAFARIETHSESSRVERVQHYIAGHLNEEIRLPMLAELVGMSTVAFSRFFHQRTGRTLSDYITDQRIGLATRLLVDTEKTVQEISFDCGFNTLSNFNRLFKRLRGRSPKEFRDNYKKKKVFV